MAAAGDISVVPFDATPSVAFGDISPSSGERTLAPWLGERERRGSVERPYFAGLYQLSKPFWSFSAAAAGVSVPLITLADSTQVSFSRLGVPRDRTW